MPHRCTNCERTFADGSTEMLSGCPECGGNRFQFLPRAEADALDADTPSRTASAQTALTKQRPSATSTSTASSAGNSTSAPRSATERARETVRGLLGGKSTEQMTLLDAANQARLELQGARSSAPPGSHSPHETRATEGSPSDTGDTPVDTGDSPVDTDDGVGESGDASPSQSTLSNHPAAANTRADAGAMSNGSSGARTVSEPSTSETHTNLATSDAYEDSAQAAARSSVVSRDELPPFPERDHDEPPFEANSAPEAEPTVRERPDLQQLRDELQDEFESIRIVERGQYELNLMELYERRECIIELQENGRYVIQVPETLEAER